MSVGINILRSLSFFKKIKIIEARMKVRECEWKGKAGTVTEVRVV